MHLRRTLYLTIMSSAGYEEAGHKLMKMGLQPGQEPELVRMIIDCCSQERTFLRFYALLAQRFCVKFFAYACAPADMLRPLLDYSLLKFVHWVISYQSLAKWGCMCCRPVACWWRSC